MNTCLTRAQNYLKARIKRTIAYRKPLRHTPSIDEKRFLFVGGLHRSGTSILHRILQGHPEVSGFRNTGVMEDEGQHLQTVFPAAGTLGGPGCFAFNPGSHMTERSELVTDSNREKLMREWGAYHDWDREVLLEKSPPNLIRSRFLQAVFPDACFVFVVRHPIAVALATQKWSSTNLAELMFHWRLAHSIMIGDLEYIRRYAVIRYEDLVKSPGDLVEPVWNMVGLEGVPCGVSVEDHNARYFTVWEDANEGVRETAEMAFSGDSSLLERFGYRLSAPYLKEWHGLTLPE